MTLALHAYLHFNGNAKQALDFYKQVFGGEPQVTTWGDFAASTGGHFVVEDKFKDMVQNSVLATKNFTLMINDGGPMGDGAVGENISLTLAGDDSETLTQYFNALSEGGTVTKPLDTFGMLTDKFGVQWMVSIG